MRTRAYRRYKSRIKALRKRKIANQLFEHDYYNNLHQYSKNKIHCSCMICTQKTKNTRSKGHYRSKGGYGPRYNYKVSDQRKMLEFDDF